MKYLNWKGGSGHETIDEIRREDFASRKEYAAEQKRLVDEYALDGMSGAYWSSRPCRNWES